MDMHQPAKGGAAINSETLVLGVYPEKESMTAGKYLVSRMLISALLINVKKWERVSMCSNRRVLRLLDIHITEQQSRQTVKTKGCLWHGKRLMVEGDEQEDATQTQYCVL